MQQKRKQNLRYLVKYAMVVTLSLSLKMFVLVDRIEMFDQWNEAEVQHEVVR